MDHPAPEVFIFIGRSGCGKGTQAKLLIDYLGQKIKPFYFFHLETGERFRQFIKGDSYSAALSRKIMEAGDTQPPFLAVYMWAGVLIEQLTGKESLICDGMPRSLPEAETLDDALDHYGYKNRFVFNLDVSPEWSRQRLLARGRSDDNGDDIAHRLAWYLRDVVPAINFFTNNPKYYFHRLNGEQPIEKVHQEIVAIYDQAKR